MTGSGGLAARGKDELRKGIDFAVTRLQPRQPWRNWTVGISQALQGLYRAQSAKVTYQAHPYRDHAVLGRAHGRRGRGGDRLLRGLVAGERRPVGGVRNRRGRGDGRVQRLVNIGAYDPAHSRRF